MMRHWPLNWRNDALLKAMHRPTPFSIGSRRSSYLLAMSVLPARTLRSPTAGIGTELLAPREKVEVTRSGSPFER
jgi:hypothetical protein